MKTKDKRADDMEFHLNNFLESEQYQEDDHQLAGHVLIQYLTRYGGDSSKVRHFIDSNILCISMDFITLCKVEGFLRKFF